MSSESASGQNVEVADLLGLCPSNWGTVCPAAVRFAFVKKGSPARGRAARLPCRSWACEVCFIRQRWLRGVHHGQVLLDCGTPLFAASLPLPRWGAARKRLVRANGSYVTVEWAGSLTLIATVPVPPGEECVTPQEGVRRLGAALRTLDPSRRPGGTRWQPVTSSRDWCPPRRESDWELLGRLRTNNPERVAQALRELGLKPLVMRGDGQGGEWVVSWEPTAHKGKR